MILFIAIEKKNNNNNTETNEEQSRKKQQFRDDKKKFIYNFEYGTIELISPLLSHFFEVEVACTRNLYTNTNRDTLNRGLSRTLNHTYSDQTINHSIQYNHI